MKNKFCNQFVVLLTKGNDYDIIMKRKVIIMGMYDYVGAEGEQVKCFYVPCITIDEKGEIPHAKIHTMGGLLRGFDEVPYQTPYYNYGKDFCIVEYRWVDSPYIHVILNAKYSETIAIADLKDDFVIPPVVIDNYGDRLNIHSSQELKEFVDDYRVKKELSYVMEVQYLSDYGLSYRLDIDRMRQLSLDELQAEAKIRDTIARKVYDKTMKLFNDRWYQPEDENMISFGLVVADYIELEVEKNPKRIPRTQDDWRLIFKTVFEQVKAHFENPVQAYFEWCDTVGINIDKEFVTEIFEKYM